MQIFALETDIGKLTKRFLSSEETVVRTVHYHWFPFFLACLKNFLFTLIAVALIVGAVTIDLPVLWASVVVGAAWMVFVFFPLLRAYIDWKYDCVIVTSDKLIVVDQSSIFRQKVTPINFESFANASAETQFWNIFPFGRVNLDLEEGAGEPLVLRYIPDAQGVASTISDTVTQFQRRKDLRRYGEPYEEPRGGFDSASK
jgi:hypothetical protein